MKNTVKLDEATKPKKEKPAPSSTVKKEKSETDSKKKGKNWSQKEENLLIDLVSDKKSIIESKATNRTFKNLNIKNQTWKDIEGLFNNNLGVNHRSLDQLKSKWDNLKTSAKKRNDALKRHLNTTGAPPDPKLHLTPKEEKILGVMSAALDPIKNEFDSDNSDESTRTQSLDAAANVIDLENLASTIPLESLPVPDTPRIVADTESGTSEPPPKRCAEMKTPGTSSTTKQPRSISKNLTVDLDQERLEYLQLQKQFLRQRQEAFLQTLRNIDTYAAAGMGYGGNTTQSFVDHPSLLRTAARSSALVDMVSESFAVMDDF